MTSFYFPDSIENGELNHLALQDAFRCGKEFGFFLRLMQNWADQGYPPFMYQVNNDNVDRLKAALGYNGIPFYYNMGCGDESPTTFFINQRRDDDDDPPEFNPEYNGG